MRVGKRDAGDAPIRGATRPDCAPILCDEFPGDDHGLPRDIVLFCLSLPFGLSGSPGYFQSRDRFVYKLHYAYHHAPPLVAEIPFATHMLVGDAMLIGVDFPHKLEQSANAREHCATQYWSMGLLVKSKGKL